MSRHCGWITQLQFIQTKDDLPVCLPVCQSVCLPSWMWKSPRYFATILTKRTTWSSSRFRNFPVFSTPGPRRKPGRASRMFSTTAKSNPHPKIPRPERLDEIYEALKKGIESVASLWSIHHNTSLSLFNHKQCAPIGHTCVFFSP